ncbi:MAG: MFS transporter [Pseudomonadota bacterium]
MTNTAAAAPAAPADQHPGRAYAWLICLVIFLSYVLVYFHRLCPSVLALEMQQDFAVSGTLLGLLGSAYFYPYGLMQLPVGMLADSWGPRKTVSAFLLLATAGSLMMAFTPSLGLAVVGRVLVGIGVSTLFVCNFKLLAEWFPPRQMVLVGGLFMAMGGVGALVAATPLALLSNWLGWRLTLGVIGGLSLVMAAAVYLVVRDRPPWFAEDPELAGHYLEEPRLAGVWQGVVEVVSAGRFWPVSIYSFCCTGLSFAIGGMWSVPYLQHVYGLTKAEASMYQNTFGLSLIVGAPLLGWWANRFGRKAVLVGCAVAVILVCAGFYFFTDSLPPWALYALFFGLFWFSAAPGPVVATYSKELFRRSIAGTSVGMVNLFPFVGAGVMQVVFGWVLSSTALTPGQYTTAGYHAMFGLSLISALIALAAAWFMPETLPASERAKKA